VALALPHGPQPSLAWIDLQFSDEEKSLFFNSTTMLLGNGTTTLF
jgi:hypothetical protein